jgi:glycosyltransferase involved in cell wall biosynthesis
MNSKKVSVSVINDLFTDQRVNKVCMTLKKNGFEPVLIGRKFKNSPMVDREYETKRFSFLFNKGPLFYFFYNLRLFFYLLFNTPSILLANDLDTLLANYLVHKIKRVKLVYDSHEYFTEVPELQNRKLAKSVWNFLEKWMLPNIKYAYTVSPKISETYQKLYGIEMGVIYNFPSYVNEVNKAKQKEEYIIYQGALNVGRGLEELIKAMKYIDNYKLHLYGSGDIENELKQLAKQLNLEDKVLFFGRLSSEELIEKTKNAVFGVSIEKPMGLSYQYAVPNKIFDYLNSGIPVYYSNLNEVSNLLDGIEIGIKLSSYSPEVIASEMNEMLSSNKYLEWTKNALELSRLYNWESQENKLLSYFE